MSSPDRITAAVLWDESHLWGLIALRALKQKGLSFNLLSAADIRGGALEGHKLLFIPGGWASNKSKALGVAGAEAIRSFVRSGGNYFGICGGAGLATRDGIGLLAAERVATQLRVPSFSGPITCHVDEHPIWSGIYKPTFWAWWPSQLQISDPEIQILARYDAALPEAFSSDIRVGSVFSDAAWAELEADYGINLNPARLTGEPAVIEGMFGSGRVVLSMLHFDTPDDARGNRVLRQAWTNLGGSTLKSPTVSVGQRCFAEACSYMLDEIRQLIDFGEQKGLWH
ncbi:MAG TPA: BPL-N domain-containing protein, partial [Dissulfurispiraceae bacterium]|nr:BPL-N domain-containing protein [Dissulfurispiraceae bacterium]